MTKNIEKLRDANSELEDLKLDRKITKEKMVAAALEHRNAAAISKEEDKAIEIRKANEALEEGKKAVEKLDIKIKEAEKKIETLSATTTEEERNMGDTNYLDKRDNNVALETRANRLVKERAFSIPTSEVRTVLVASGGIAKPTVVNGINDTFPILPTITDYVKVRPLLKTGGNKVSFKKTNATAYNKVDGSAATESSPTYGTVSIAPVTINVSSFVSNTIAKLTPLDYYSNVQESALIALKLKLAEDVLVGDESINFKGILNSVDDDAAVMYENYPLTATSGSKYKFDADFLKDLALSYGGDVVVYSGTPTLVLNKKDLIALGHVRGTNEKKALYSFTFNETNPNIGTIQEGGLIVKFLISDKLAALSDTEASATPVKTMVYGNLTNYELDLFSNYEIKVSTEEKMSAGLLSIYGEVTAGGSISVKDGFKVVTLATA